MNFADRSPEGGQENPPSELEIGIKFLKVTAFIRDSIERKLASGGNNWIPENEVFLELEKKGVTKEEDRINIRAAFEPELGIYGPWYNNITKCFVFSNGTNVDIMNSK